MIGTSSRDRLWGRTAIKFGLTLDKLSARLNFSVTTFDVNIDGLKTYLVLNGLRFYATFFREIKFTNDLYLSHDDFELGYGRSAINFYILLARSVFNEARFIVRRTPRDSKLNFISLKLRKMIAVHGFSREQLQTDTFSITLPVRYNVFRFNII